MSEGFVYFIENSASKRIKIGFSVDVNARLAAIQTANDCPVVLLGSIPGSSEKEKELHDRFSSFRTKGEWFDGAIKNQVMTILGRPELEAISVLSDILDESKPMKEQILKSISCYKDEEVILNILKQVFNDLKRFEGSTELLINELKSDVNDDNTKS